MRSRVGIGLVGFMWDEEEGRGRGEGEGMGVGFGVGDVCGVVRDGMGWDEMRSISYNLDIIRHAQRNMRV